MSQVTSSWEDAAWPLLHCPNALSVPPSTGHWKKRGCNAPAILSLGKRCIVQPHSFLSRAANSFPANPTTRFWFSLSQCQISKQHPELIPHWLQRFYLPTYSKRSKSADSLRKRTWSCSASKQDVFQSVLSCSISAVEDFSWPLILPFHLVAFCINQHHN